MSELSKCTQVEAVNPKFPYMPKEEWQNRIDLVAQNMTQNGVYYKY